MFKSRLRQFIPNFLKRLHIRIWKYFLYGLFLFCFTSIFYMIFDGIFRGGGGHNVPSFVYINNYSSSDSYLHDMTLRRQNKGGQWHGTAQIDMRAARVAKLCKDFEVKKNLDSQSLYVLSSYHFYNRSRICACEVPKAASTSIKKALLTLEYPEKAEFFRDMPGYRVHTQKEVRNVTDDECFQKSNTSFLVTRDPYARLYSAYIDKIYLEKFHRYSVALDAIYNKGFSKEKFKEMIVNEDRRLESLFCSIPDVSFEQFLKTIARASHLDIHFAPVSILCQPCSNKFDFVLKQETLSEDTQHLFNTIYESQKDTEATIPLKNYTGETGIESQIVTYYTHWKIWLTQQKCDIDKEMYDAINRRLWNGLKLLGSIDEDLEFIEELFRGPVGTKLELRNPETIMYEFKANKVPYLNAESREKQRLKFLKQAYRDVDKEVIRQIQLLFLFDFILFDYDPTPPG